MATEISSILNDKGSVVHTIERDANVTRAADLMRKRGIAALVVTEGESVIGLIGEREIVAAVADAGDRITSLKVRDVMDKAPETCAPDDQILRVMATMTRKRRRHVPVVENGRLCGIVSIGDMIKFRLDQMDLETRVLRDAYLTKH